MRTKNMLLRTTTPKQKKTSLRHLQTRKQESNTQKSQNQAQTKKNRIGTVHTHRNSDTRRTQMQNLPQTSPNEPRSPTPTSTNNRPHHPASKWRTRHQRKRPAIPLHLQLTQIELRSKRPAKNIWLIYQQLIRQMGNLKSLKVRTMR